jgi:hypothetical protein
MPVGNEKRDEIILSVYSSLYPDAPRLGDTISNSPGRNIFFVYYHFLSWWDVMNMGHIIQRKNTLTSDDMFSGGYAGIWLFYGFSYPVEGFFEKLAYCIITNYNEDFTYSDYASLLYASLQEDEVKSTLEGLPLSMLNDMFKPVIQQNIDAWLLVV